MKIETVLYPEKLLKEEESYFDMRLYLTEEEMLSLVSSLTAAVHEYRTKGIEYEIPREVDVSHRQASGAKKKPKPIVGHGRLVLRLERQKR